jgi:hypothetical protein
VPASDPLDAVLRVLEEAGEPLARAAILERLAPRDNKDQVWRRIQPKLRAHPRVLFDGTHYLWSAVGLSPWTALELLAGTGVRPAQRRELADLVRAALGDDQEQTARQRRTEIDARRALAELASEVEELVVNEASAEALIHRVRARVARSNLEPVARAGEDLVFDRTRHRPIGGGIRDGSPVVVVRPGYVWRSPGGDVLVAEVLVEE